MSDPNQPPQYPGPEQPFAPPPYAPPPYAQAPYGQAPYGQPAVPPPSPYAHWGLRLAAYLLDSVLVFPLGFIAGIGSAMADDPNVTNDTQTIGILIAVGSYAVILAFSIWNLILRQGRTGSSLGKKWIGIAVINEQTGRPIGGWPTFGRQLLHILDALPCYLGFLWPLWDDKKQTFADKIMKTVVVPIPKAPQPVA